MSTYVLVHGVAHGAWCWERTRTDLTAAGHRVLALDLPLTSLEDDAAVVVRALDDIDGPVILVGHSYGGLVISRAADGRDDVDHLVYVAAILLAADEVATDVMTHYPPMRLHAAIRIADDGTFTVAPEDAVAAFYAECDATAAAEAVSRLRPTALAGMMTPPGGEPWQEIPTTYVVCERDEAVHPDSQRDMAARADHTVTLDTDHSPFLSRPEPFLASLLAVAD